ncbi:hypothetical protein [Streptomyces sp. NPDC056690]|uniref:hypothetical protein n=1 Tax=unclassified Streptomyces TaxID=2593676 RepID=UPI003629AB0D
MLNEIPHKGMMRLTCRGRASLIAMGALVAAAAAVVVPLLLPGDGGTKVPQALTVPEGWRASQVYEALDKALGVPAGTAKKAVPGAGLKLPTDAAAISPPQGDWLYFVTVKPGDARFTADFDEQQKNVPEFNKPRTRGKPSSA